MMSLLHQHAAQWKKGKEALERSIELVEAQMSPQLPFDDE